LNEKEWLLLALLSCKSIPSLNILEGQRELARKPEYSTAGLNIWDPAVGRFGVRPCAVQMTLPLSLLVTAIQRWKPGEVRSQRALAATPVGYSCVHDDIRFYMSVFSI
jgi:hypothetical protein